MSSSPFAVPADAPAAHPAAAAPPSRTKIVCTLGPASTSPTVLRALMEAGMNVARVNFSHGTHADHAVVIRRLRDLSAELGRPVAILGDLQGPRIRVGVLPAPRDLAAGTRIIVAGQPDPDEASPAGLLKELALLDVALPQDSAWRKAVGRVIPVTHAGLAGDVTPGHRLLINDGLITLEVEAVSAPYVLARVVVGGRVSSNKGINLPGIAVSVPSLTDKDRGDVAFAVAQGLDYLALSFVRSGADLDALRALVPGGMKLVAKIEKDVALQALDEIVAHADGVMVARGDLGVELPFEQVPLAQKRIIRAAIARGVPVITATQMLESMVSNPRPTRAEASDVANAILDGTDAVMLSAETAAGSYPVLAVEAMTRIIREVERAGVAGARADTSCGCTAVGVVRTEDAIATAAVAATRNLGAPAILVVTQTGFAARVVAAHRPGVPIVALTDRLETFRQLALVWGAVPVVVPPQPSLEALVTVGLERLRAEGLAAPGDRVVVTAGVPFDQPGTTSGLRVETV